MKRFSIIRNLIITAFFLFSAYGSAFAVPQGVGGLSNPNSIVCAKDASGNLWCDKTNSAGVFNIIGGVVAPTTNWGPFPIHGLLTLYNIACPNNGMQVDRDGPSAFGGPWLDVSCQGCVAPPTGMVAWYPLDEAAGTTAHELTQLGFGFPNPLYNASPLDGKFYGSPTFLTGSNGWVANALKLDGLNDYVEAANNPALNFGTGDFSIDCWVKIDHPNDTANAIRVIVEKREQVSGSDYRGYSLFLYKGKLSLQLAGGNYANYVSSLPVPADGLWHFVAVTVDRNSVGTFYLSQGTQGSFTIQTETFDPTKVAGSLDNSRPLRIGSLTLGGPTQLFKGSIDEVELFNRALAGYEIESLVSAGRYGKCKPCFFCQ